MSQAPELPYWHSITLDGHSFQLLNLDHLEISTRILGDLDAGITVTYDYRWDVTARFGSFLLANPEWVAGRTVLVLGAGVGLETLVIGRLCRHLYLNDLAPAALALSAEQLQHNGIAHFTCLCGRFETLPLPPVDLVVGCYLVFSRDTAAAMRQFLARATPPVLLINDNLLNWQSLLKTTRRPYRLLLPPDDLPCVLFDTDASAPKTPW